MWKYMIDDFLLKKIIKSHIDSEELKKIEITNETLLLEDLLFDSIKFIQLVIDLEETFDVIINDLDIVKYNKYSQLSKYFQELKESKDE